MTITMEEIFGKTVNKFLEREQPTKTNLGISLSRSYELISPEITVARQPNFQSVVYPLKDFISHSRS